MRWHKIGQVFSPAGQHAWMVSHAANPVAEHRDGDEFRVYFGCRDSGNRAHIGYVDIELNGTAKVLRVAEEPVVAPGLTGTFDDSGTSMGCLASDGRRTYLYYLGWNLGVTVPWRNSIGLAVREDPDGPFVKQSLAPLLDRNSVDPYTLSYPSVLREADRWRMWYGSNLRWGGSETDMDHVIKYAESADGLKWQRNGTVALALEQPGEYALCRPWVMKDGDTYRMWYCFRGQAYRFGYAESHDGVHWERYPESAGLDVSTDGWDSEMVAYPSIVAHRDRWYLFYNGNRYGKTGFGVAVTDRAA